MTDPSPQPGPGDSPEDRTRTELVVLGGMAGDGVEAVIGAIRRCDPSVVVLHHDMRDLRRGRVHRRPRDADRDERSVLELAHGCVVREDVLPTLAG
ncbi:MAG: hypothetical protein L0I76_28280 [Pseudonocardia sp.]|nr:hypothetical protein [Pseudonocardia sp.]